MAKKSLAPARPSAMEKKSLLPALPSLPSAMEKKSLLSAPPSLPSAKKFLLQSKTKAKAKKYAPPSKYPHILLHEKELDKIVRGLNRVINSLDNCIETEIAKSELIKIRDITWYVARLMCFEDMDPGAIATASPSKCPPPLTRDEEISKILDGGIMSSPDKSIHDCPRILKAEYFFLRETLNRLITLIEAEEETEIVSAPVSLLIRHKKELIQFRHGFVILMESLDGLIIAPKRLDSSPCLPIINSEKNVSSTRSGMGFLVESLMYGDDGPCSGADMDLLRDNIHTFMFGVHSVLESKCFEDEMPSSSGKKMDDKKEILGMFLIQFLFYVAILFYFLGWDVV